MKEKEQSSDLIVWAVVVDVEDDFEQIIDHKLNLPIEFSKYSLQDDRQRIDVQPHLGLNVCLQSFGGFNLKPSIELLLDSQRIWSYDKILKSSNWCTSEIVFEELEVLFIANQRVTI